jgi:single-strand DNA-binding protein
LALKTIQMAGVNKVILIGHLGKDPEVRHLENGTSVANFTLATSESYKDKAGNRIDQTEWHNIVVWRGLADVAEKFLKKGSQIYLEGKIRTRSWEDQTGNKRYTTEIVADTFNMLSKRDDNGQQQQGAPQSNQTPNTTVQNSAPVDEADDLPF